MQKRLIETFGVLKMTETERESLSVSVLFDLLREPDNAYLNFKSRSRRGLFGYCEVWFGERVVRIIELTLDNQIVFHYDNPDVLDISLSRCDNYGIGKSIENLANALKFGLPVLQPFDFSYQDVLEPYQPQRCPFDAFRFKLFKDARANVFLDTVAVQECQSFRPILFREPPGNPEDPADKYPKSRNPADDPSPTPGYDGGDDSTSSPDGLPQSTQRTITPTSGSWLIVATVGTLDGQTLNYFYDAFPGTSQENFSLQKQEPGSGFNGQLFWKFDVVDSTGTVRKGNGGNLWSSASIVSATFSA